MSTSTRLPTNIKPTHYELTLDANLDDENFRGEITTTVSIEQATDTITLHAENLAIIFIETEQGNQNLPCSYTLDAKMHLLTINFEEALEAGEASVTINYAGKMDTPLAGLYISRFTDDDDNEQKIASTQFQAPHARKCFPCWDEPAFKASLSLTLVIDESLDAIANGAERSRTTENGKTTIVFEPTIDLSSYLYALVIGPLEKSETVTVGDTEIRVVHRRGKENLTSFALTTASFALQYFSDYFGVNYPGKKIDLVAIPDFAMGAMENQGCITFRESALLIEPNLATQNELQRTADVITHEISHMWFGNLVTMKWWNGLWLNEAFATFMTLKSVDAYKPQWDCWTDFALSRSAAYQIDATSCTRPIEFEVHSPNDAEAMFDVLTYEKGASLVRMLEQYLGEKDFQKGIQNYISQHSYSNTETEDLWLALSQASNQPVKEIMETWIFQGSFPVVEATSSEKGLTVSQRRVAHAGDPDTEQQLWSVPVSYRTLTSADTPTIKTFLLEEASQLIPDVDKDAVLLLNTQSTGFFRVARTVEQAEQLLDNRSFLTASERYSLVDDFWSTVLEGKATTSEFLTILETMGSETNRSVWQRILAGFGSLSHLLDGDTQKRFEPIIAAALQPAMLRLGLGPRDQETQSTKALRGDLIKALGILANDQEIQDEAQRTVSVGIRDPELVDPGVLNAALAVTAFVGDEADYYLFKDSWKATKVPQEENRYLAAMASFDDPELVAAFQKLILDKEIRIQTAPFMIQKALSDKRTSRLTWSFVKDNWDFIVDTFADATLVRMLAGIVALDTPEQALDVSTFLDANPIPVGEQTLLQLREILQVRVALREREASRLAAFIGNS